jgi:hypothetical protein
MKFSENNDHMRLNYVDIIVIKGLSIAPQREMCSSSSLKKDGENLVSKVICIKICKTNPWGNFIFSKRNSFLCSKFCSYTKTCLSD